ncbi:diguanylate cyclase domain-containing protein [Streptomyces sp. NPDC059468]|uniref:diguanylate cyclase domain-containing protein n=1 Tax=Streptomyces sp. NPDC059468 TaxID=3346845 RepID=UPI0036AEC262
MEPAPRAASNGGRRPGSSSHQSRNPRTRVSDLDDFKAINDTHGHAAGDVVLTATARRLSTWCGGNGIAARLGGDEFAAIVTTPDHTAGFHALQDALDDPVDHNGHACPSRPRSAAATAPSWPSEARQCSPRRSATRSGTCPYRRP